MDSQLRKALGFALLFALVFGMTSAERAVALPAVACPGGNTIMVTPDTPLTVVDADRAAMEADPSATRRKRTMQELFDCAINRRGSTLQLADGTYDDVGIISIGSGSNRGNKVTFRGNPENREAVKFTGEVNFNVRSNNVLIEYITFEDTENIEMAIWPVVTETLAIQPDGPHNLCRENVEIRNCVFRNTRKDGVSFYSKSGKTCNPSGFTIADSLFENIGYNNEWEDGYGPGDTGTGIPKLIPATLESDTTTHKSGTTLDHLNQSRNYAIRIQGGDPSKNVTITGNTINGTTHSGIFVRWVTGGSSDKIEISNNIVNNVPRSGIHVLEGGTRNARGYSLIIKNNLVVNSGNSPWLVSDYDWYKDSYSSVKSILSGGTTDKRLDSVLKPEIWSITENIVKDGTVIFGSDEPPVNIYDNFGGDGNPTDGRASEYRGNGNRVSTSSSKIPVSEFHIFWYSRNRAGSCIEDDDTTMDVDEDDFACFSVVRSLDPYTAGAIQLTGVSTSGTFEIMENELRDNTLGLVLCGGVNCYFDNPYSAVVTHSSRNAAFAKPDISMNNIYGESAMSAADRSKLSTTFAKGAVYASIGALTDKVDLDGNYLGQDPKLITDPNSESLSEVSEYTGLETSRLDIEIPLRLIAATTVAGDTLTLTYSKTLDPASVPAASDFTVMVDGEQRDVDAVSVNGAAVTLTLASAVEAGDAVTVSYTPGSNPLQDASGEDVDALTARGLTNNTPPALTTAVVNRTTLTLTYNDTLDEGSVPAASDFTVMVDGEQRDVDAVSVNGAAVTLTLASTVAAGDAVIVSYTPGSNPIRNASRENAVALTDRAVTNNTPRPRPTRPRGPTGPGPVQPTSLALTSAAVAGGTLTLTYSKTLDEGSVPAAEDFTVMVDGEERDVTAVSVSGAAVTLTLTSTVAAGDAVTVSYTPGDNPIRDTSGENAVALTDDGRTTVSNNTSRPTPPGGGGSSSGSGGGCALTSGGSGGGLGMLLALMAVPFGFAAGGRAREAR